MEGIIPSHKTYFTSFYKTGTKIYTLMTVYNSMVSLQPSKCKIFTKTLNGKPKFIWTKNIRTFHKRNV